MKLSDIPEYARKYKTKGYDVRLSNGKCRLFRITSERVEGKAYPVLRQEYVGTIGEDGALTPKKADPFSPASELVEHGLSHFIESRFKRDVVRSIYGGGDHVFRLAVCQYVYGHVSRVTLLMCGLTHGDSELLLKRFEGMSKGRLAAPVRKIAALMEAFEPDPEAREELTHALRSVQRDARGGAPTVPCSAAREVLEAHGIRIE